MQKLEAHAQRIPGLDLLRTFAILLVFIWHYQKQGGVPLLSAISPFGWTGILFFVLSGYLIASQLFKPIVRDEAPSLSMFYLKRSFRILPAYLVVVGLYFVWPSWNESRGLAPLWKFLTFTLNFGLDRADAGGFSHAWSLCVEEHFYLLLPTITLIAFRLRKKIRLKTVAYVLPVAILILGALLRGALWFAYIEPFIQDPSRQGLGNYYDKVLYYPTYCRLDGLVLGVATALLLTFSSEWKSKLERAPNAPAFIGLLFVAVAVWLTQHRTSLAATVFGYPAFAFGYAGLVLSAALPRALLNRVVIPGAGIMATLAFTFYLTHKQIIRLLHPTLKSLQILENPNVLALAIFIVCLVGATLLHMTVEQPFLTLRDRILSRKKDVANPSLLPSTVPKSGCTATQM